MLKFCEFLFEQIPNNGEFVLVSLVLTPGEMSGLVQYSDSDTDDDTDINQQGKRKLNDNGSSGTEKKYVDRYG